jgi:hypothetical protein
MPAVEDITYATVQKIRKLLMVIAENVPLGPKKIYLNNTNLMHALSGRVSEGTLREIFFANQTGSAMTLTMPRQGDFMADGKYLFEVGGSRKTFSQIADQPDSYLALDDIETGSGNRIPLWMFGMMYRIADREPTASAARRMSARPPDGPSTRA